MLLLKMKSNYYTARLSTGTIYILRHYKACEQRKCEPYVLLRPPSHPFQKLVEFHPAGQFLTSAKILAFITTHSKRYSAFYYCIFIY